MADKANKNDTVLTYTSDVHALVTHGAQAIARQRDNLKDVSHKDVQPTLVEALRVLEQQKSALAARVEALGGKSTAPVKDAVSAIAGAAAGLINAVRQSESVKSLRDDATYFSSLGVAYMLLYTTSLGFGDTETSKLAERGYRDAARMIMQLDRVLPKLTVEELRESDPSVVDASSQVKDMVTKAWDRAAPFSV